MSTREILVAVDGSEASERVATFVNGFFGGLDVTVTAINVGTAPLPWGASTAPPGAVYGWGYAPPVPPAPLTEAALSDPDAVRESGERTIASAGIEVDDRVVEVGDVADTIRRIAAERQVDMIVVGSNHKGFLDRLLSPSVSKEIAESAPAPVLVVH